MSILLAFREANNVVFADTINTFKNRLDNFWSNQELLYDHKADLHGIGNRRHGIATYYTTDRS